MFNITLKFLEAVKENNNTTWLHTYRDLYQNERAKFSDLVQHVLERLVPLNSAFEGLTPKDCIFRFNKDIRFAKDKQPYKDHFGAVIAPGGRKSPLPCLYIHLQPGNKSMIAGGLYLPATEVVHATRKHIAAHLPERNTIISNPKFKKIYGQVLGADLVKMPRGYDAQSPAAQRFLHKSRYIDHMLSDEEVCDDTLIEKIIEYYKVMQPLNDFLERGY